MDRHRLPVVTCSVATQRLDATTSFCTTCALHVTDLSAMTEAAAHAWLRRRAPGRHCISYRVRPDDSIVFAPSYAAFALGPWLALVVACAGHLEPDAGALSECRDAAGYEIECPPRSPGWLVAPDDAALRPTKPSDPTGATVDAGRASGMSTITRPDAPVVASGERVQGAYVSRLHLERIMMVVERKRCLRPPGTDECWPAFLEAPTQSEALASLESRRAPRRAARAQRIR